MSNRRRVLEATVKVAKEYETAAKKAWNDAVAALAKARTAVEAADRVRDNTFTAWCNTRLMLEGAHRELAEAEKEAEVTT
jgi:hypothetical protein